MENPQSKIPRIYHVKIHGVFNDKKLSRMRKGVMIEGESYLPEDIQILPRTKEESTNTWISITLTSGKNREIRKLCEFFNLQVVKLIRFSYGHFSIKDCPKNGVHKMYERDVKKFMRYFPQASQDSLVKAVKIVPKVTPKI